MQKTGIFWFTHDLRLSDNPGLVEAAHQCDQLLCVYIVNPKEFHRNAWGIKNIGAQRWRFIRQSIDILHQQLNKLGQHLHICIGEPSTILASLIREVNAKTLYCSEQVGWNERSILSQLRREQTTLNINTYNHHRLFEFQQLPFDVYMLPSSFKQFSNYLSMQQHKMNAALPSINLSLNITLGNTAALPPSPLPDSKPTLPAIEKLAPAIVEGGELAALAQLDHYFFNHDKEDTTKDNETLIDGKTSSKFSTWLAHGCLSPRQIMHCLHQYEAQNGENWSTKQVFQQLLRREFFQYYALTYGKKLFQFKGANNQNPSTHFDAELFAQWCQGDTPYPLVNACMEELNATGYMSLQARKVVASALINELNLDWRYGAAYFEQQLIDYDVANNWGNWQYLSGVSSENIKPIHLDVKEQTQLYDIHGHYRAHWQQNKINRSSATQLSIY